MIFSDHFNDISADMWQVLKHSSKPIVLYGMGDGADKIIAELEKRSITVSGVFASDGFVPKKQKIFHGHTVESYSDIKSRLGDVTVLVCFGTKLDSVLQNIIKISEDCELYAPDVPVFGDGILDKEYFYANLSRFEAVYNRLYDNTSKNAYICALKYRITGKPEYLFECETESAEGFRDIFAPREGCTYIDIGAYNGDTIREFSSVSGPNIDVLAFEPDIRNFKKLSAYADTCNIRQVKLFNAAAWDRDEEIEFFSRSGRNSAGTTSHDGAKSVTVQGIAVDSVTAHADYVKIDAEGSDKKALLGMKELISRCHPDLCVAAYHRTEDYFDIPECVFEMYPDYKLMFRHSRHIPCWDTNFYFIKKR